MSSFNIRDIVASRKAAIKEQMTSLRAEMAEIKAVEAALDSVVGAQPRKKSSEPTIKEMIVDVLEGREDGATSDEIITLVKDKYEKAVPRSSMSPQLSRLKGDERVTRENERWMLPKFASGNSDGASDPADNQQDDNMADEQDRHGCGGDTNGAMPRMSEEGQAFDLGE